MLAYLETADDEQREEMRQMLNDIADLSTDEESPTMNTGGRGRGLVQGTSAQAATAFLHGVAATQLSGCDGGGSSNLDPNFATCMLTLWTLAPGAYTWWWLQRPVAQVVFPPSPSGDVAVQAQSEPVVDDELPLQRRPKHSLSEQDATQL